MTEERHLHPKKKWNKEIVFGGVSANDMYFFTRHLALSLKSGLTLIEALNMLQDQSKGRMKQILGEVIRQLEKGGTFHEALERFPKYFSALYINLVKTGEVSGTLEKNLYYVADNLKKVRALKQKITSAMMYPLLILTAAIGLVAGMILFVLPKILPLFKSLNVELPITTKILIFVADVFANYGLIILIVIVLASMFLGWLIKQNFIKPYTHWLLLKIPVLKGIIRITNLEMFTHTLNTLLLSGIPLDAGLRIMADATQNRIYRAAIRNCIIEIQKGHTLAQAIKRYPQLFPQIAQFMVAMGEKTGNLDVILGNLSEFYEEEVDTIMKNLSTVIEPVLLIFIGLIVGTVAMGILGPIYKITGNIN